jgi:nucleoside-diphosphate-sugar epimerase
VSGPVLVTGAAGHIGTLLRGGLPERGFAVRCVVYDPQDDAQVYAEALIEAHGEPNLTDPVHARGGGELTTAAFDADSVTA